MMSATSRILVLPSYKAPCRTGVGCARSSASTPRAADFWKGPRKFAAARGSSTHHHHFLDFRNGLRRVEALRAGLCIIHDGVTAIEPKGSSSGSTRSPAFSSRLSPSQSDPLTVSYNGPARVVLAHIFQRGADAALRRDGCDRRSRRRAASHNSRTAGARLPTPGSARQQCGQRRRRGIRSLTQWRSKDRILRGLSAPQA
jgi:hypothetical protein